MVNDPVTPSDETEASIIQRNSLLRKIAKQLEIFDSDVENAVSLLRSLPMPKEMPELIRKISEMVADYNYDGAFKELDGALRHYGIDLENGHE